MIQKEHYNFDIFKEYNPGVNIHYYGECALEAETDEDTKEYIKKYLFKDCIVEEDEGIIIGFSDDNQANDYYFIVYIPRVNSVTFQLINDPEFINSIRV